MAKKKKKADLRGYATTSIASKPPPPTAAVPVTSSKVSETSTKELKTETEQIINNTADDHHDTNVLPPPPPPIKLFPVKVKTRLLALVKMLLKMKCNAEFIQEVLAELLYFQSSSSYVHYSNNNNNSCHPSPPCQDIASILNVSNLTNEAVFRFMCEFVTEFDDLKHLPSVFVDMSLYTSLFGKEVTNSISVVQVIDNERSRSAAAPTADGDNRDSSSGIKVVKGVDNNETYPEEIIAAVTFKECQKKESSSEVDKLGSKRPTGVQKGNHSVVGEMQEQSLSAANQKSDLELELEKVQSELVSNKELIANEANCYMMSKDEIKDVKKMIKFQENQVKKVRKQIERQKKQNQSSFHQDEMKAKIKEDQDEDEGDSSTGFYNIFDEECKIESVGAKNNETASLPSYFDSVPSMPSSSNNDYMTPKKLLYDYLRKSQKYDKAVYKVQPKSWSVTLLNNKGSKIGSASFNVSTGPHIDPKLNPSCIIDSSSSAQGDSNNSMIEGVKLDKNVKKQIEEYLTLILLYTLNPAIPLYRTLPPEFRELWLGWKKQDDDARDKQRKDKEEYYENIVEGVWLHLSNIVEAKVNAKYQRRLTVYSFNDENDSVSFNIQPTTFSGYDLKNYFGKLQESPEYQKMLIYRRDLPMYAFRNEFLQKVVNDEQSPVTILCAETGAGKTTQCPQFLLEHYLATGLTENDGSSGSFNIICTQPRRIAAISVAERVSSEINDDLGGLVGYNVRLNTKRSNKTKLMFCTTGILLRQLQDDPLLTKYSHVIVDEVHERQWQTDFLLIALKYILEKRKDLKVILMSATLDVHLFSGFFDGAPVINVPGRTFPVQNFFLEDILELTGYRVGRDSEYALREFRRNSRRAVVEYSVGRKADKRNLKLGYESDDEQLPDDFIEYSRTTRESLERVDERLINYDLIEDIVNLLVHENEDDAVNKLSLTAESKAAVSSGSDGSILIFLTGIGEIRSLTSRLQATSYANRLDIIPLHSSLSPKDQRRAFTKARRGLKKIIIATNIAETSVTIPDCVCVIDTGLVRELKRTRNSTASALVTSFCSRASSKQRQGRAGRVQAGVCFKMYSSRTYYETMVDQTTPELQRLPLEEVCLNILVGNFADSCEQFLSQAPQPPTSLAIQGAIGVLEEVGAIEVESELQSGVSISTETLTLIGRQLVKLPVDVRIGKMILFGYHFGCLDKILSIAAFLSVKSPFLSYFDPSRQSQASAIQKKFIHPWCDFFTFCNIFEAYQEAKKDGGGDSRGRNFCRKNCLSYTTMLEINDLRNLYLEQISSLDSVGVNKSGNNNSYMNRNNHKENILIAVLSGSLLPNIGRYDSRSKAIKHKTQSIQFHSSSINKKNGSLKDGELILFHEKFTSNRNTTVSITCPLGKKPLSIILFTIQDTTIKISYEGRNVTIGKWLILENVGAKTAVDLRLLNERFLAFLSGKNDDSCVIEEMIHFLDEESTWAQDL